MQNFDFSGGLQGKRVSAWWQHGIPVLFLAIVFVLCGITVYLWCTYYALQLEARACLQKQQELETVLQERKALEAQIAQSETSPSLGGLLSLISKEIPKNVRLDEFIFDIEKRQVRLIGVAYSLASVHALVKVLPQCTIHSFTSEKKCYYFSLQLPIVAHGKDSTVTRT